MFVKPQKLKFTPTSPWGNYRNPKPERTPLIWDRIDRRIRAGRPNVILIEGGGQCGKSTLAQYICSHYDALYRTVYTTDEILQEMTARATAFKNGDRSMLWKWWLFDEVNSDAPRQKWHDARNQVLGLMVGLWGELKQNMVMTLPDIDEIAPRLYRNIAVRAIVDAEWKNDHVQRTAFLFKPKKDIQKKGYKWGSAGMFEIPDFKRQDGYIDSKMDNMLDKFERFRVDLKRQEDKRLGIKPTNFIPTPISEERMRQIEAKINEKSVY